MSGSVLVPLGEEAPAAGRRYCRDWSPKPPLCPEWWQPPVLHSFLTPFQLFPWFNIICSGILENNSRKYALCIHYINSITLFFRLIKLTTQIISIAIHCAFKNRLMDWCCLLSYSCPLLTLWEVFLAVFKIQIYIPESLCRTRVCSFVFHGTFVDYDLPFLRLCFPAHSQPSPWATAIQSPWGMSRHRHGSGKACACVNGCGKRRGWTRKKAERTHVRKAQGCALCGCFRHMSSLVEPEHGGLCL